MAGMRREDDIVTDDPQDGAEELAGASAVRVRPDAESWLRKGGLRATRQRIALAEALLGEGGHRHVTAERLYSECRARGEPVSLATVYNTLRAFCEAGLLREVAVDGERSWFDTCTEDHPHYFIEDGEGDERLIDAPAAALEISGLPGPLPGTELAGVDVVIRLRRKPAGASVEG